MPAHTAGLLMWRRTNTGVEYFLVHPGGPYWAKKDTGAWSIPKGLLEADEQPLVAAQREFEEETGIHPVGPFTPLGSVKTRGGKILHAWMFAGTWEPSDGITSNYIEIEFPYKSNRFISIPEADRAAWMPFEEALIRINPSQVPMLQRANEIMDASLTGEAKNGT